MKKTKIIYWAITGLFCAFILLGAIMDVLKTPDADALIKLLGYPEYFIRFIGIMKILGVVGVLIPNYPRIKEWAYAGLAFDSFGAAYSHIANGDGADKFMPAILGLILLSFSYIFYHKKEKNNSQIN